MPTDPNTPDAADAVASALADLRALIADFDLPGMHHIGLLALTKVQAVIVEAALARLFSPTDDRYAVTALKITANRLPTGPDRDAAWGALDLIARLSRSGEIADEQVRVWLSEMDAVLHEAEDLAKGRVRDLVASTHARLHEVSARLECERSSSPARVPDEVVRLSARATQGEAFTCGLPWFHTGSGVLVGSPDPHVGALIADTGMGEFGEREWVADPDYDAAFIVAAWNYVRSAIADQERAARAGSGQDGGL